MNSYLSMAGIVLRKVREPLSAKQILDVAYKLGIVPSNLFGKTQHKTLQARLSEDILRNWERSEFVRTEAGRFFLRQLMGESNLFSGEYIAPRRINQLKRFEVVCFSRNDLLSLRTSKLSTLGVDGLEGLEPQYWKLNEAENKGGLCVLRIFIILHHSGRVLIHSSEPSLPRTAQQGLSVGIAGFVMKEDHNLFSLDKLGVADAYTRVLTEALHRRLSENMPSKKATSPKKSLLYFDPANASSTTSLVAVTEYKCSNLFSAQLPTHTEGRHGWSRIDVRRNDAFQFDEWSQHLFQSGALEALTRQ